MRALILNCTLKPSPEPSSTEALAGVVGAELTGRDADIKPIRIVDLAIKPGVQTDQGEGDQWPSVHDRILASEILIIATPTRVGHPSSVAHRVLERMDTMIAETDERGRPVAYDRVAGVVVTGNEDGAHHVNSEISGGLSDIGYTIPPQAWTYWHLGPGPDYLDEQRRHDWAHSTGSAMAANLHHAAQALQQHPYDSPPE
jgi:multimeric flavodoxin WrbA